MLFATLLALGAAALHAGWNLLVKTSGERGLTAWAQFVVGGTLLLPVLAVVGLPDGDALPQLGASALVHVVYVHALVDAYRHGDFSVAYPVARGGGALLAAVGGSVLLDDRLTTGGWVAAAVVAAGLASLVDRHASRRSLLSAATTGVMIATYTLIDASGSRAAGDGLAYGVALTFLSGVALTVVGGVQGRIPALVAHVRDDPKRVVASGVALTMAYSLVMVAVRHAPVGYVAMLRESSVVLGALAGWLLLGEALGHRRLVSALVIAGGLVGLVATS